MQLSLSTQNALPLVEQIVGAVCGQIDDRLLRPGARLPAIRQLAEHHGISRFTRNGRKAYDPACRPGLSALPKRGGGVSLCRAA